MGAAFAVHHAEVVSASVVREVEHLRETPNRSGLLVKLASGTPAVHSDSMDRAYFIRTSFPPSSLVLARRSFNQPMPCD